MTLRNGLDLSRRGHAYLTYQARWFIEKDWDIAKIQVSRDAISWETLDATGVPYAILGANDFIGGKPDIPIQDRPFRWEARDGSRLLTWLTYGSYIEGFFEWCLVNIPTMLDRIPTRIQEFEDARYPFDAVLAARASDDNFPSDAILNLAEEWNASCSPRIILSTPEDFFDHLLSTYGDRFPVYRGDASGLWEDVCLTTPARSSARTFRGVNRRAPCGGRWFNVTSLETPILNLGEMNGAPEPSVETDKVALTWCRMALSQCC